jgi:hypothetical protein
MTRQTNSNHWMDGRKNRDLIDLSVHSNSYNNDKILRYA